MEAGVGRMATNVREQGSTAYVAVHAREKDEIGLLGRVYKGIRARLLGGPHAEQAMRWACAAATEFGPPLLGQLAWRSKGILFVWELCMG